MKGKFKNITDEKPMITSRPWIYRCCFLYRCPWVLYAIYQRIYFWGAILHQQFPNVPTYFRDNKQDILAKGISGF